MTSFYAWAAFALTGPPAEAAPLQRCTAFAALTRTATVERDMAWREARLVARTTETTEVAVQTWTPRSLDGQVTAPAETCREGARRFCEAQGALAHDCRFAHHDAAAAPSWDTALLVVPPAPTKPAKPAKPKRERPQKRRNVTTP